MKKIITEIIRIFAFILFIVLADKFTGKILEQLYQNSTDLTTSKIRYSLFKTNEDILIFGSSRAQHHYVPDTISKKTGFTAYNCGLGGQFLTFSLIQISETLKRYKPRVIILDIYPDMLTQQNFDEKLKILGPYYHNNDLIREILNHNSRLEKLKYTSSIYPYNGLLYNLLLNLVYSPDIGNKGYLPISGMIDTSLINIQVQVENHNVAEQQVANFNNIINLCQGKKVPLWILISPIYKKNKGDMKIIQDIRTLAQEKHVRFIDFAENPFFSDFRLFKDNLHLNDNGANKYSGIVGDSIQSSLR